MFRLFVVSSSHPHIALPGDWHHEQGDLYIGSLVPSPGTTSKEPSRQYSNATVAAAMGFPAAFHCRRREKGTSCACSL